MNSLIYERLRLIKKRSIACKKFTQYLSYIYFINFTKKTKIDKNLDYMI